MSSPLSSPPPSAHTGDPLNLHRKVGLHASSVGHQSVVFLLLYHQDHCLVVSTEYRVSNRFGGNRAVRRINHLLSQVTSSIYLLLHGC
jgi:hypothetical protein